MSKITKALKKAQEDRNKKAQRISPVSPVGDVNIKISDGGMMRNSWLIWVFIVGVVITVLVAFNYQDGSDGASLSEIFPDEETYPVDIEYEFVQQDGQEFKALIKNVKEPVIPVKATKRQESVKRQTKTELTQKVLSKTEILKRNIVVNNKANPAEVKSKIQQPILTANELKNIPYTIQVASFKNKTRANKAIKDLKHKDLSAYIVSRNLGDKGRWFRIYVGKFESKNDAETTLVTVKKYYKDSFIIAPRK